MLTLKVLFPRYGLPLQQQGDWGRAQLLATPFREYERQIRTQLSEMFSASGFDAARDIAGIVLNRWGHAYVSPGGFFFGSEARVAAVLAAALAAMPGESGAGEVSLSEVTVTGGGYLSLTVTPDTLARLAVRITLAGAGCARSLALRGVRLTAPRDARLAGARDWPDARERLLAELAGRLSGAAGAEVTWTASGREEPPGEEGPRRQETGDGAGRPGRGGPRLRGRGRRPVRAQPARQRRSQAAGAGA